MSKGFIKVPAEEFNKQQNNLVKKIGNYTDIVVPPLLITGITNDAKYLGWSIGIRNSYITTGFAWTSFEHLLYNGDKASVDVVPPPIVAYGIVPTAVKPGMRARFSDVCAIIKKDPNYTNAIGLDLGIVEVVPVFVPEEGKPDVTVSLHTGHPFFKYLIDQYQGAQIYKDSGDGKGFLKYDKAIMPTYTDDAHLPASGVAVLWRYKFVYLYGGVEVGSVSSIIEVMVTGM